MYFCIVFSETLRKRQQESGQHKMPSKTFTNSKFSYPLLLFQIFGKEFCRSLKENMMRYENYNKANRKYAYWANSHS